jgi:hypothetical protein
MSAHVKILYASLIFLHWLAVAELTHRLRRCKSQVATLDTVMSADEACSEHLRQFRAFQNGEDVSRPIR